jgi:predicted porin
VAKHHLLDLGQIKLSFVVFGDLRMKKSLIALAALSAFATAAQAQSSVTVYGLLDAGYATSNIDHGAGVETNQKAVGGLHSANGTGTLSGSRLGFRGTEDLGGGLKANFVLETGINYSNGVAATATPANTDAALANAAMFANVRQGWAGLSGGFGDVRIGTHNSLAKDASESIDPNAGVTLTGASSLYQAGLAVTRPANAITYLSPRMSGVQFQAQMDEGESTTSATVPKDNSGLSFALNYVAGKLTATAWTEERKKQAYVGTSGNRLVSLSAGSVVLPMDAGTADVFTTTTATSITAGTPNVIDKVTQDGFGATYNFGIAKVAAMTTKLKFKDATAADNGEIKSNLLGVEVPVNAKVMVRASVSTGEIKDNGTKTYDLDGYQLVAMYSLSKRSHLYAAIGETKYDSPTANSDVKINQMGVGLRTTF